MSYIIAIAGKGGTGKTTTAALLVRLLKSLGKGSILAVDADPNSNLGQALGLDPKGCIGAMIDGISANPGEVPAGMSKNEYIEYKVATSLEEADGFDLLTMGRPEGPGCYCYVNNVLRDVMAKLVKKYNYVVIDNEAGLEHLSRRTMRSADVLLVVSDASSTGLKAASRISGLVKELKIKVGKQLLMVNRSALAVDKIQAEAAGLEFIGSLPFDPELEKISLAGSSLLAISDAAGVVKALEQVKKEIFPLP